MKARFGKIGVMFTLLWALATLAGAAEPASEESNLRWTEQVGLDFLTAASEGDIPQAEALIGPALKLSYDYAKEPHLLREWLNNSIAIRRLGKPTIDSRNSSPSGNEVVFRGAFAGDEKLTPFTLRLAKEGDAWLVSFFRLGTSTAIAKPGGK